MHVRLARDEDAELIRTVINSAFRAAEEFFVAEDRVDLKGVLNLLMSGNFLLAERKDLLLGSVYVELRPATLNAESTADRDSGPAAAEKSEAGPGAARNSQFELRNSKSSRAYLGLLAVDPTQQQSGIGTMLMDAAEDHCRGLGAGFMDIIVVNLREELLGYYRRRGYVQTGTSAFPKEIKTNQACHFIKMSKPLSDRSTLNSAP